MVVSSFKRRITGITNLQIQEYLFFVSVFYLYRFTSFYVYVFIADKY